MANKLCVIILTYNSAAIIGETIRQARKVSENIIIVDSFSTDATESIVRSFDCIFTQRKFTDYGQQRNWAIQLARPDFAWQLHLDADEVLDEVAILAIQEALLKINGSVTQVAYLIRRKDYFLGRILNHSGLNPWHLRLFPSMHGACETRLYDQHFVSDLPTEKLAGFMHDKNSTSLAEWTMRHNRWSDLEAAELQNRTTPSKVLEGRFFGDPRQRTRFIKNKYYRLPSGIRSIIYFFYRYVFRLGFLDGKPGFYFCVFQALWFRVLIDAKLYEARTKVGEPRSTS